LKYVTVARWLNISPAHLSDIKNGRKNWTIHLAEKMELLLGVSKLKCVWPDEYGSPWADVVALPEVDPPSKKNKRR